MIRALSGQHVPYRYVNCVPDLLAQVSEHPGKDILLSTEVLESLFQHQSVDNPVISFFSRNGFDVVLVGYYRNQPQRINSGYAQAIKSLHTDISLDQRVNRINASGTLDYSFWPRFAAEHGCALLARPFNAGVRTAGIIEDFLSTIGLRHHGIDYGNHVRANRSPGPCALAAILEVMRRAEERGHKWTHPQRVRTSKFLSRLMDESQFAEEPFCGLDTKLARQIQAFYQPSNDHFARAVWGEDWATVFAEDVDAEFERNAYDPETASAETKERYAAILDQLWSGMEKIMNDPRLRKDRERVTAKFD